MGMHLHKIPADLPQLGDSIRPDAAATEAAGHAESLGSMHGAHAGDPTLDGATVCLSVLRTQWKSAQLWSAASAGAG